MMYNPTTDQKHIEGLALDQHLAELARDTDAQLMELLVNRRLVTPTARHLEAHRRTDLLRRVVQSQDLPSEVRDKARHLWQYAEGVRWKLAMTGWPVARYYSRRFKLIQMSQQDLLNEAAVGLYEAAKRFNPAAGSRFSTYARWWVRAQLKEALANNSSVVHLPDSVRRQRAKLRASRHKLLATGVEPTSAEVAAEAGVSPKRARHLAQSFLETYLDANDDDDAPTQLPDVDAILPDERLAAEEDRIALRRALLERPVVGWADRHREIVLRRFGLKGPRPTLAQLGRELGCTGERVRQLEQEEIVALRQRMAVIQGGDVARAAC